MPVCAAQNVGQHVRTGFHSHKCPNCKHVWQHSNRCGGNIPVHTCPKCGTVETYIFKFGK